MERRDADLSTMVFPIQVLSFLFLLYIMILDPSMLIALIGIVLIECLIIYQQIIAKKKGTTLFLWQLQFALLICSSIIQSPQLFFNSYEVPSSVIILSISIIIVVEFVIFILFVFKERVVKHILKGIALSMISIALVLMLVISIEGVQIINDVGIENFVASSDWKPNPSIAEEDTFIITTQSTDPISLLSLNDLYNIQTNNLYNITLTIKNNQDVKDIVNLDISTSTELTVNISTISTEISPHGSYSFSLGVISNTSGNGQIGFSYVSNNTHITSEKNIQVVSSDSPINIFIEETKLIVDQNTAAQKAVELIVENPGSSARSIVFSIESPDIFKPSISGTNWNYSKGQGTLTIDANSSLKLSLALLMVTYDVGNYTMNVTVSDKESNATLEFASLSITYVDSHLIFVDGLELYVGGNGTNTMSVTFVGRSNYNCTVQIFSDHYSAYYLENGNMVYLNNESVELYIPPEGSRTLEITFESYGTPVEGEPITIFCEFGTLKTSYGILPTIAGTVITTLLALLIAIPMSIGTAIFLAMYCPKKIKIPIKTALELIAGIPSVIIGLWAFFSFGPFLASIIYPIIVGSMGQVFPFLYTDNITYRCLMSAGIILGIMIFPIITVLTEDAISAVDQELVHASMGVGATRWQSIWNVVLVKAKSGITSAVLLGTGRAIGETMAVVMVMGAVMTMPSSLFQGGATMTSLIALNFTTLSNLDVPRHALLGIAALLFFMILCLNLVLFYVNRNDQNIRSRRTSSPLRSLKNFARRIFFRLGLKVKSARTYHETWVQKYKERLLVAGMISTIIIGIAILVYILVYIIISGGLTIQLDFFFEAERKAGKEGGFLNAIVGSLSLIGVALAFAVPFSLASAVYVVEYADSRSNMSKVISLTITLLSSTPSIIFGAFGFMVFVIYFKFGFSLLAGGLTLGIMILPILLSASIEAIKSVSMDIRNASYALGVSKWQTIKKAVLPTAMPSITSGLILAVGRAIGETAAVLITAGYSAYVLDSVLSPAASLPNMIYQYYELSAKYPTVGAKVYSAALVLIMIVLILNITAKSITAIYKRKVYGK